MKYFRRKTHLCTHSGLNFSLCFSLAAIIFSAAATISAFTTSGHLDTTFSGDGKLTDGAGAANGVVIQSDGKIVVSSEANGGFALLRYNPDGSADSTFGDNGRVTTPIGSDFAVAIDLAAQPDGRIVVAGYVCPCDDWGAAGFALVRYNPDGSLDLSFDGDGKVTTAIGLRSAGYSVAIQPDGKIIVAGWSWQTLGNITKDIFALARYNPDGSLDTTFAGNGTVTTSLCSHCNDEILAVALQPDGKIVAVGGGFDGTSATRFHVVRYNANGSLDITFDFDGVLQTQFGIGQYAKTVTVQADGKIVAGGISFGSSTDFALARYNSNGSLDTTFDSDGKVTTPIGAGGAANAVALQPDGKIVAAGYSINGSNADFALVRYNPSGSLDPTFGGGDGKTTADFELSNDYASGMALDNVGRVVVVGNSAARIGIARFLLTPKPAVADFDGDGRSDISVFRPSDGFWYIDGSTQGFSSTSFGHAADRLTAADYDGDGKTDISVFRDGTWFWLNSSNGVMHQAVWGIAGDSPQPSDYTGDGRADLAVFRNGTWFVYDVSTGTGRSEQFGIATDRPVAADYDGDGRTDLAVYRDGVWYLNRSSEGFAAVQFGMPTDRPVVGDYDGDGKTDIAVYRGGTWYLLQSRDGFNAFQFGIATDIPTPSDYDGDGRTEAAVFRNGIWYQRQGTSSFASIAFGLAGDKPVPAAYLQ